MPRAPFADFALPPLFAVLSLLAPGLAARAGPPEGASAATVLDEVADGLRRYRLARTPAGRVAWLERLAPTPDPRVRVALGRALTDESPEVQSAAAVLLLSHVAEIVTRPTPPEEPRDAALRWWKRNEA